MCFQVTEEAPHKPVRSQTSGVPPVKPSRRQKKKPKEEERKPETTAEEIESFLDGREIRYIREQI